MKLRIDIRPYFPKIANYYWDTKDPATDGSIWDWLGREYDIIKIGHLGDKPELWVSFPDEKMIAWFMLRWV
jgi:hypothetical protein